jgi:DNA-binding SARP family transcriptional activator
VTDNALAGCAMTGHQHAPDQSGNGIALRVLGTFDLTLDGESLPTGIIAQRLLTLVAVKAGRIPRTQAAGILWPTARTERAAANLRTTLWRLQQCCRNVIDTTSHDLRLARGVGVDIHQVSAVAFGLTDRANRIDVDELRAAVRCNLYDDITPDVGDEDWLVAERERFRQLRVHALEALAARLIAVGWHGAAIEAALGAIRADPFRESAHRLLIKAHLAEGSRFEARRHHRAYRELLHTELGLAPSDEFITLLNENRR